MRTAAILLAISTLATPVYAQSAESQDHSAHHPAAEAAAVPIESGAATAEAPSTPGAPARSAASGAMNCSMMPEMMQSMMRGMMQGMRGSGSAGMGPGMGSGMGGAMAGGQMQPADQSLSAITYRAIAQRTVSAIRVAPAKGDAEFLRLAAVLEEALADAAKAAAAFSDSPEVRQKAQQMVAAHQDDLRALRALLDARK
ncbi:hypothetical protein [Alsobacter sp. R-9]